MCNVESEIFEVFLQEVTLGKFDANLVGLADLEEHFENFRCSSCVRSNSHIIKERVDEAILDWDLSVVLTWVLICSIVS